MEEQICNTDKQEHAVEGCGAGAGDAEGACKPAGGAEGVGQAEHPGADDGHDDVPQRLRGRRAPPPLQQRHLRLRRHGRMNTQLQFELEMLPPSACLATKDACYFRNVLFLDGDAHEDKDYR